MKSDYVRIYIAETETIIESAFINHLENKLLIETIPSRD